jgi:lipoprotein signal peptidase
VIKKWYPLLLLIALVLEFSIFHFFDSGVNEVRLKLCCGFAVSNVRHYKSQMEWEEYIPAFWIFVFFLFSGLILGRLVKLGSLLFTMGVLSSFLQRYFYGYNVDWITFFVTDSYSYVVNIPDIFIFGGGVIFLFGLFLFIINTIKMKIISLCNN